MGDRMAARTADPTEVSRMRVVPTPVLPMEVATAARMRDGTAARTEAAPMGVATAVRMPAATEGPTGARTAAAPGRRDRTADVPTPVRMRVPTPAPTPGRTRAR